MTEQLTNNQIMAASVANWNKEVDWGDKKRYIRETKLDALNPEDQTGTLDQAQDNQPVQEVPLIVNRALGPINSK